MAVWQRLDGGSGSSGGASIAQVAVERAAATAPLGELLATAALAAVATGVIVALGPLLGMRVPPLVLAVLALGAVAVQAVPARAVEVASATGLVALAASNRMYALYHAALVALLYVARRSTLAMVVALGGLAIWLPKHLFAEHYLQPGLYNWINEASLVLALFMTASWWRARRDRRLPAAAEQAPLSRWALMYFFPGHAVNPMIYAPGDLFRERRLDPRGVLAGALLVAIKALAHFTITRHLGQVSYATLDAARAVTAPRALLWQAVVLGYVDLAVTLSGTADVAVLLARLYGWPMASPFRFALLAWNPVELWRRWGIYNRKLLLSLVYFPLGGNSRRRYLNVILTFLASALLLHTGWFGSKYWEIGPGGWRDETVYFLIQAALVCGYLLYRRARRSPPLAPADHDLRWSWQRAAGTVATQAASALAHVVVLAHALPFPDRFALIARCLGLR
jgi:hypothetical protein